MNGTQNAAEHGTQSASAREIQITLTEEQLLEARVAIRYYQERCAKNESECRGCAHRFAADERASLNEMADHWKTVNATLEAALTRMRP